MTKGDLLRFLEDRPGLSLTSFSKDCGWTAGKYLRSWLNKHNDEDEMTESIKARVIPTMIKYGYKPEK